MGNNETTVISGGRIKFHAIELDQIGYKLTRQYQFRTVETIQARPKCLAINAFIGMG
jgi:hypothetical protein